MTPISVEVICNLYHCIFVQNVILHRVVVAAGVVVVDGAAVVDSVDVAVVVGAWRFRIR